MCSHNYFNCTISLISFVIPAMLNLYIKLQVQSRSSLCSLTHEKLSWLKLPYQTLWKARVPKVQTINFSLFFLSAITIKEPADSWVLRGPSASQPRSSFLPDVSKSLPRELSSLTQKHFTKHRYLVYSKLTFDWVTKELIIMNRNKWVTKQRAEKVEERDNSARVL